MRVLLDACVPKGLRRSLYGHEVRTAHEMRGRLFPAAREPSRLRGTFPRLREDLSWLRRTFRCLARTFRGLQKSFPAGVEPFAVARKRFAVARKRSRSR